MSRKLPSFGQLASYIDRDEGQEAWRIRHNIFARDPERIRAEFERNGALLAKRKNGVYLYHEIISITRAAGLPEKEQKERLHAIAQEYIASRCPDNLVFGGLHQDQEHSLHYHLMISANRAGENKRLRLSKAQFRQVQVQLERHVLQRYPELEQKVAIEKRAEHRKARGEAELERRTGVVPKKDQLRARLLEALEQSRDRDSLLAAFGRSDFELYVRGKSLGVIDLESGGKHRLKTLDLELLDRVEALMRRSPEPREHPERQSADTAEARREMGAERAEPERAGPEHIESRSEKGEDRRSAPEPERDPVPRNERQQAWREEIDQRRAAARQTGPEREPE